MRSHLVQAVAWLLGPALATLFVLALIHAVSTYQPVTAGHALQAPAAACVTSPDEMFNDCAVLDTSQVQDLRTGWDEKVCADAAGTHCWTEHHTDDTDLEVK
jgi:hypothetical protein